MREFGPVQPKSRELANDLSVKLIERIWADWGRDELGWGSREGEVDLYTVRVFLALLGTKRIAEYFALQINVPLVEEYLSNPKFYFTRVWRNNYTSLFKPIPPPEGADELRPCSAPFTTPQASPLTNPLYFIGHPPRPSPFGFNRTCRRSSSRRSTRSPLGRTHGRSTRVTSPSRRCELRT